MIDVKKVISILGEEYPDAQVELKFRDVWELLVAVILSAQCTDVRVNKVTPALFKRFPSVRFFAKAEIGDIEKLIFSTGFYRNKAKNIKGAAEIIVEEFEGKVPSTMEELLKLPGVARKTANVVLSSGFGKDLGIVVDTHMIRLSGLLGLIDSELWKSKNAVKIEAELMKIVPKKEWGRFSHLIVWHGRRVCIARRPKCEACKLNRICPSAFKFCLPTVRG